MLNVLLHPVLSLHGPVAYLLVAVLCFGEAAVFLGFFLPGETAVVFGGVLAYEHHVDLVVMIVVVVCSAIGGDSVGFEVGRHFGPRLLETRLLAGRPAVSRARDFVRRRGALAVFIGRFTAVFRALVPGIAGTAAVPYPTFLAANASGGLVWGVTFTLLGYGFGAAYETVLAAAGKVSVAIIAAAVAVLVAYEVRKRVREHRELLDARALGATGPGAAPGGNKSRPEGSTIVHGTGMLTAERHLGGDDPPRDEEKHMPLQLGDTAPDFTAETTEGQLSLHEYLGDGWGVLFSHPADFTPVCTTELGDFARRKDDFAKRNTKLIGVSVDPVASHKDWAVDIKDAGGTALNYPLIGGDDRVVANLYDMIHPNAIATATVRTVFVIGPDKKVKLTLTYPANVGRNVDEILRVIDALQLSGEYAVSTPVNWKDGDEVIISPAISDEDAKEKFPKGFRTVKPYLRYTPQPNR